MSRPSITRKTNILLGLLPILALAGCGGEATTSPSPTTRLVEAGWSFGFCLGPCNGALAVDGEALSYEVRDRERERVLAGGRGELTTSGSARLGALLSGLPSDLLETYGCPDCADAGAAHVVVERGDSRQRASYEYPSPPRELADLDAFLKELMDALGRCQSTAEVSVASGCNPLPE